MKIEFKTIELFNFMSFDNEVFDFEQCSGMNLVQGKNNDIPNSKNGVGKSQLYLSLLYALFGQLQTKIKNENLINRYAKTKDMIVSLVLSVDDVLYKIRRSINKGKQSVLELFIYENDDFSDITKSTIAETQEYIEKNIIHCDITIFLRTILLTADQTYNFYMLKKSDKKEFVEKMFDISIFEDVYKSIHRNVLDYDKESITCQHRLMTLNKNMDDYISHIDAYNIAHEKKINELTDLIVKFENDKQLLESQSISTNSEAVEQIENTIDELEQHKSNMLINLNAISTKISQINLGIHKIDESVLSRNKLISKHADILNKLCDDCKDIFKSHYDLKTLSDEILTLNSKKIKLNESLNVQTNEKNNKQKEYDDIISKISLARSNLKELTAAATKHLQEITHVSSKLSSYKYELDKLNNETNPYISLLEKCKLTISDEEATLSTLNDKLKYLKFAENIVSQETLRKFIIKDLIVLLNNKIKTYLTKLGAQYYVEFDEDMDYEFITHSGSCEWSNFSAGERMRIMIATSFAFRDFMSIRNGLNANILILDEYFDSAIDTLCVENILNILKDYSLSQQQNIFVISHRSEVNIEQFDRIIKVEKTNGIAHVQYLT